MNYNQNNCVVAPMKLIDEINLQILKLFRNSATGALPRVKCAVCIFDHLPSTSQGIYLHGVVALIRKLVEGKEAVRGSCD